MKGFDRLNIKSAVKSHSKMDLSRTHLTTAQFGQIIPLFCEETVPGDKINVSANYFSRMSPLVKPTYGKFSFHTMSVFVPYFQLADDVEAWLAGKTTWEGVTPSSRFITMNDYVTWLITGNIAEVGLNDAHDFVYVDASGSEKYVRFNSLKKYWVKIMNALGYALPQGVSLVSNSAWKLNVGPVRLSALPLLAFGKAYNDWMSQSQRYNSAPLTIFLRNVRHNATQAGYNTSSHNITAVGIDTILSAIRLCYETDYFLSAWQKPNNPINQVQSISGIDVEYADGANGTVTLSNSVNDVHTSISYSLVSQRALDWLQSFDNWVRRNNYSGSRAVQQVYSRFGVKTDDYRSNYVEVINTDIIPIQVGDVTATATTDATVQSSTVTTGLGDYAGKGIMNGQKGISYKANDYGILLILGWYTVSPMNAYGFDRKVLRSQPFDYYNPEFDGLGAEAISYMELYCDPLTSITNDSSLDTAVYGFTERYNSYRFGRDNITGEFRNFIPTSDMNVWHTGRLLSAEREDGDMIAQNTNMVTLDPYSTQFNRMFSIIDGSYDNFYLTCQFSVDAVRPMMSLNEVPRLGEGDTSVPRNGNEIN